MTGKKMNEQFLGSYCHKECESRAVEAYEAPCKNGTYPPFKHAEMPEAVLSEGEEERLREGTSNTGWDLLGSCKPWQVNLPSWDLGCFGTRSAGEPDVAREKSTSQVLPAKTRKKQLQPLIRIGVDGTVDAADVAALFLGAGRGTWEFNVQHFNTLSGENEGILKQDLVGPAVNQELNRSPYPLGQPYQSYRIHTDADDST